MTDLSTVTARLNVLNRALAGATHPVVKANLTTQVEKARKSLRIAEEMFYAENGLRVNLMEVARCR